MKKNFSGNFNVIFQNEVKIMQYISWNSFWEKFSIFNEEINKPKSLKIQWNLNESIKTKVSSLSMIKQRKMNLLQLSNGLISC
jgi:hypothetical protein